MIVLYAAAVREMRLVLKTLWLPGILLFCAIALPWYIAVQMRNPEFFHEFIMEHNLGRFSKNLYHHTEPFWYYLPVAALALVPWTVFVMAALVQRIGRWWAKRTSAEHVGERFRKPVRRVRLLLADRCPLLFFSISQSKLPGYILPAIPAGGLLLAEYLRGTWNGSEPVAKGLVVLHALLAGLLIVPALLIAYLVYAASPSRGPTDGGGARRRVCVVRWNRAYLAA